MNEEKRRGKQKKQTEGSGKEKLNSPLGAMVSSFSGERVHGGRGVCVCGGVG